MRRLNFNLELIRSYYESGFANDLQRYFDISARRDGINFIGFMSWHGNPCRVSDGCPATRRFWRGDLARDTNVTEKHFIFSGLYYFMILIPQALRKMLGKETEYNFYRASGWPLSSAGLGGYLHPAQMLSEASLLPCQAEKENYLIMLPLVSEFMIKEIRQFLSCKNSANINPMAYTQLVKAVAPRLNEFIDYITKITDEFTDYITNSSDLDRINFPPYILTAEDLKP